MTNKRFTPEEANRTLPLVAKIVEDVAEHYVAFLRLAAEYRKAKGREDVDGHELEELRSRLAALSDQIEEYARELGEIGCELKDPEKGLIDFPSEMDGREIYLCWMLGEDRVEYWHEIAEGFRGRQPLSVTV